MPRRAISVVLIRVDTQPEQVQIARGVGREVVSSVLLSIEDGCLFAQSQTMLSTFRNPA